MARQDIRRWTLKLFLRVSTVGTGSTPCRLPALLVSLSLKPPRPFLLLDASCEFRIAYTTACP